MRREASHLAPHRFVETFVLLSRCLSGRMTVLVRKRSLTGARSATFTSTGRGFAIPKNHFSSTRHWPAAHPAPRARSRGGRNARATIHALARVFDCPPAIHPRESPAATGVAAFVIQQARKLLTYALNSLCGTMLRTAIENHFALVQKLWTMTLPCGKLRKSAKQSPPA
jgi:hypothetical protein